eukprot:gene22496-biopygen7209
MPAQPTAADGTLQQNASEATGTCETARRGAGKLQISAPQAPKSHGKRVAGAGGHRGFGHQGSGPRRRS